MPHMTKKSEIQSMPVMPSQMVLPTVDMEYLFRFEGTLAGLEKGLHNDDDPKKSLCRPLRLPVISMMLTGAA